MLRSTSSEHNIGVAGNYSHMAFRNDYFKLEQVRHHQKSYSA